MTHYEINHERLNETLDRLEPFFRSEFSDAQGASIMKKISAKQYPNAHLIMQTARGIEHARVTTAVKKMYIGEGLDHEPIFDYHVKFRIAENYYQINTTVEHLFLIIDVVELNSDITYIFQLDPRPIVDFLDKVFGNGNSAATAKGYPTIGGYYDMPLGFISSDNTDVTIFNLDAVINSYKITWSTYTYIDNRGVLNHMLPKSIKRSWPNYRLAMPLNTKAVVAFCKETKDIRKFNTVKDAAIELLVSNPNPNSIQGEKSIASAGSCISRILAGQSRRSHGKDGHWWTFIEQNEAQELNSSGRLKDVLEQRFAKQKRPNRKKRITVEAV